MLHELYARISCPLLSSIDNVLFFKLDCHINNVMFLFLKKINSSKSIDPIIFYILQLLVNYGAQKEILLSTKIVVIRIIYGTGGLFPKIMSICRNEYFGELNGKRIIGVRHLTKTYHFPTIARRKVGERKSNFGIDETKSSAKRQIKSLTMAMAVLQIQ